MGIIMKIWLFFGVIGFFPFLVSCASLPEEQSDVPWADLTLHATGVGAIEGQWTASERFAAIQRAKMNAYLKLQSQVMMLPTASKKTVRELARENPLFEKKLSQFVRSAKIVRTQNTNEGIKITTELYLGEHFMTTMGLAKRKPLPTSRDARSDISHRRSY